MSESKLEDDALVVSSLRTVSFRISKTPPTSDFIMHLRRLFFLAFVLVSVHIARR
jgi:hypothetical protein